MWPDRVSNPGPLTYKSGALPPGNCSSKIIDKSEIISVQSKQKTFILALGKAVLRRDIMYF